MSLFGYLAVTVLAFAAHIALASRRPRGAGLWVPLGFALACVLASGWLFAAGQAPLPAVLALGLMPFAGSTLVVLVISRTELARGRWLLLACLGGATGLVAGIPAAVFLS